MRDTDCERERERGRDTGRGGSRLHAGSPMWNSIPDSRIMPWAEGRPSTAEPSGVPNLDTFLKIGTLLILKGDSINNLLG